MQMKAGYVWILLLLATAASASPPPLTPPPPSALVKDDETNADVLPLSVVRESNEKDRLALTPEPVVLTQQEELVKKKSLTANVLTPQERQAEALIEQKSNIYTMKVQYKEALAEQQKVWEKHSRSIIDLHSQPWWKILTPGQQVQCHEYMRQQEQANLRLQNIILKTWGQDIVKMTWIMESFDSDAKPQN